MKRLYIENNIMYIYCLLYIASITVLLSSEILIFRVFPFETIDRITRVTISSVTC